LVIKKKGGKERKVFQTRQKWVSLDHNGEEKGSLDQVSCGSVKKREYSTAVFLEVWSMKKKADERLYLGRKTSWMGGGGGGVWEGSISPIGGVTWGTRDLVKNAKENRGGRKENAFEKNHSSRKGKLRLIKGTIDGNKAAWKSGRYGKMRVKKES